MTGAIFGLAFNTAMAVVMAIAFFALGHFDSRNRASNWFGVAFLLAALSFSGEYVLFGGWADASARLFIALTMLGCFVTLGYGLSKRYAVHLPALVLMAIFIAFTGLYLLILNMPRGDFIRQALYQAPYALLSLMGIAIIMRSGRRHMLDMLMIAVLAFAALTFVAKPMIAVWSGGIGEVPQDYVTTLYAAISMLSGGIAGLLIAMVCLALVVSDSAAVLIRKAERDEATGLLNQSGFEHHGIRLLSALNRDSCDTALILAAIDLPADTKVEEALGVPLGDAMRGIFGPDALIARISGLSFAILLPQTNLMGARRAAEVLRVRMAAGTIPLPSPAEVSIGIAEREPGHSLSDMLIRAQWALDEARRTGGNCVRLAARSAVARPYVA
jgi:GGDEF domain-containing protein